MVYVHPSINYPKKHNKKFWKTESSNLCQLPTYTCIVVFMSGIPVRDSGLPPIYLFEILSWSQSQTLQIEGTSSVIEKQHSYTCTCRWGVSLQITSLLGTLLNWFHLFSAPFSVKQECGLSTCYQGFSLVGTWSNHWSGLLVLHTYLLLGYKK